MHRETQASETSTYINQDVTRQPPRQREKEAQQTGGRGGRWLLLSFGLLCVLQVILNVSLRLLVNPSGKQSPCNVTECPEPPAPCQTLLRDLDRQRDRHNQLLERFNALNADISDLQNINTKIRNMKRRVEEERDMLKRQLQACSPHFKLLGPTMITLRCPGRWRDINSRCYQVTGLSTTWARSQATCQRMGGDLVIINSHQKLFSLIDLSRGFAEGFWIGLDDSSGSFRKVDGSSLSMGDWLQGHPTGSPMTLQEQCEVMSFRYPGGLETAPCDSGRHALCEREL